MYKAYNDISLSLVKSIFPTREILYNLRNYNSFQSSNVHTVFYGTETISFRGPQIWNMVPENIKQAKTLLDFKNKIRNWEPAGCTCRLCKTYLPGIGFL